MARREESIFDMLMDLPWWVSVIAAALVYVALALILPSYCAEDSCPSILRPIISIISSFAPFVAFLFVIPAAGSVHRVWRKRKLLDDQVDIESIRNLDWRRFEELVGEYYRRQGFRVIENRVAGADGGVDVRFENHEGVHLVQCKRWRTSKVNVSIIRELFGVVTAEAAASGIVVTRVHSRETQQPSQRENPSSSSTEPSWQE